MGVRQLRKILTNPVEQAAGPLKVGIGQRNDEFLAAIAADQVAVAQARPRSSQARLRMT